MAEGKLCPRETTHFALVFLKQLEEAGFGKNEICHILEIVAKLAYPYHHVRLEFKSFEFG